MRVKAERIFVLTSFEELADGEWKHVVDDGPAREPSFEDIDCILQEMVENFKGLPTGTRIRVIVEDIDV